MRPTSARVSALLLGCALASPAAGQAAGLPTRDLNPMLQPILIPSLVPVNRSDGWRADHSFFITNTLQQKKRVDESLIIDVENYRYELDLGYRHRNWRAQVNLPLMSNDSGELDTLIEDWHDFFGFPQGKRDEFPRDRIDIEYLRDGVVVYRQDDASSGIGDIALTLGYQPDGSALTWYAALELPTGSASDFSGNEALDAALWFGGERQVDNEIIVYGIAGLSFPGDDGKLEGLLVDVIGVAQLGFEYHFNDAILGLAQLDMHTRTLDDSELDAFGNSLQIQLGLGFLRLVDAHRLDLFFSEDILVGSAPDISFGLRLARDF